MTEKKPESCNDCSRRYKGCIIFSTLHRRDNPELKTLLTILPGRCNMFSIEEPRKNTSKAIELGFHDDSLLKLTIDAEKMQAVLKIQTYNWEETQDKTSLTEKEKAAAGKVFYAKDGKVVELVLELEEEHPFFHGDLHTIYPSDPIFGIYIDGGTCYVQFAVYSELMFKIKSYKINEASN